MEWPGPDRTGPDQARPHVRLTSREERALMLVCEEEGFVGMGESKTRTGAGIPLRWAAWFDMMACSYRCGVAFPFDWLSGL